MSTDEGSIPKVARGPDVDAPTFDDVISGALQEALDEERGESGHVVLEWALIANVISPDGPTATIVRYRDDEVTFTQALGLVEYARICLAADLTGGDSEAGDD